MYMVVYPADPSRHSPSASGNVRRTIKRFSLSSSKNVPPCSSVRLLAIERPSPLPSVLRLRSPTHKAPHQILRRNMPSASFAWYLRRVMLHLFRPLSLPSDMKRCCSPARTCRGCQAGSPAPARTAGRPPSYHRRLRRQIPYRPSAPFPQSRSSNSPYAWSSIALHLQTASYAAPHCRS